MVIKQKGLCYLSLNLVHEAKHELLVRWERGQKSLSARPLSATHDPAFTSSQRVVTEHSNFDRSIHVLLALAFKRGRDLSRALMQLNVCLESDPRYIDARLARGQVYLQMCRGGSAQSNNAKRALADFNVALIQEPVEAGHEGVGLACAILGRLEESEKALSLVLATSPHLVEVRRQRAWVLLAQGRPRAALQDLSELLLLSPR
jgi:tetratricopeptide (TPR) repeat protein